MKINRIQIPSLVVLCITLATAFSAFSAGIDRKFYKKIADEVWNAPNSDFNANAVIPDSVLDANSAVIIAWSDDINVDHIVQNTIYSSTGQTNRLKKKHLERTMVKLNDQSAIDRYSEMEFGRKKELSYRGFIIYSLDEAFGARIHKPDGTVTEVDLTDAIETGHGKKGKDDISFKLAIPGLEPGDVLDFFKYSEELAERFDLDPEDIVISASYPVLTRRVNVTTHPNMTVEYKCYNGVPNLQRGTSEKNYPVASLVLHNVPGVNFKRYVLTERQLPFIRVQCLNNVDRMVTARSARGGGLYGNIHTGKIISEFGDYLKGVTYDSPLNGRVLKMVKDYYMPRFPEATSRQIADAAWLALFYQDYTAKNENDQTSGQFERALIFNDVINKLGVYPTDSLAVGLINPRTDVPIDDVSAWNEASFVVKTPDAHYFIPKNNALSPGEIPGAYKGEKALLYYGDRKNITPRTLIREYFVPAKPVTDNSMVTNDTITIDGDILKVKSSLHLRGANKADVSSLTNLNEWIAEVEDFFDIPQNKRYKDKSYDPQGRNDELIDDLKEGFETIYGTSPDKLNSASFVSRGIRPDVPEMTVVTDSEFTGLVESFGDNIMVSLGKIMGMPKLLIESERDRLLDMMLPFACQETHVVVVKKPAGYRFDEGSVEALRRQVIDVAGQFFITPAINENGDLQITSAMRDKFADIALNYWPTVMNRIDEEASFADASVVLVRE